MTASVLVNATCLVRSTLTAHEILGIVDKRPRTSTENSELLRFPRAIPSAIADEETKDLLDIQKLDQLFSERQRSVRQMMFKHCLMWNGQRGQINSVQHHIAVQLGS